jgi:hypothetical protein
MVAAAAVVVVVVVTVRLHNVFSLIAREVEGASLTFVCLSSESPLSFYLGCTLTKCSFLCSPFPLSFS